VVSGARNPGIARARDERDDVLRSWAYSSFSVCRGSSHADQLSGDVSRVRTHYPFGGGARSVKRQRPLD
jgi:hypothetical protein